jgi:hypothetical protein
MSEHWLSEERSTSDSIFGYPRAEWEAARGETRRVLIERAKSRGIIGYAELIANVKTIQLERHSPALSAMLGEVASLEDAAGRGMLTAVVIHKYRDQLPGPEFYQLAQQLGRDTSDRRKCWSDEAERVYAQWSGA